jgi:hypothetical protein
VYIRPGEDQGIPLSQWMRERQARANELEVSDKVKSYQKRAETPHVNLTEEQDESLHQVTTREDLDRWLSGLNSQNRSRLQMPRNIFRSLDFEGKDEDKSKSKKVSFAETTDDEES